MNRILTLVLVAITLSGFDVLAQAPDQKKVQDPFSCSEFVPPAKPQKLPGFIQEAVDYIKRQVKDKKMPQSYLIPSYGHIVVLETEEDWKQLEEKIWHPAWGTRNQEKVDELMQFNRDCNLFVLNHAWPVYVNGNSEIFRISDKAHKSVGGDGATRYEFQIYAWVAFLAHETGAHIQPEKCGKYLSPEEMLEEEIKGAEITIEWLKKAEKQGYLRGLMVNPNNRRIQFVVDAEHHLKSMRERSARAQIQVVSVQ